MSDLPGDVNTVQSVEQHWPSAKHRGRNGRATTFLGSAKEVMAIPGFWNQMYTALAVSVAAFSAGNAMGWGAPMMLKLTDPGEAVVFIPKEKSSLILVLMQVSSIVHMMVTGAVLGKLGRRAGCWFLNFLAPCGWGLLLGARDSMEIFCGAALVGSGMISGVTVGCIYLSEVTNDRLRGPLISLLIFFNSCGMLMSHVLGEYMSWERYNITCLVISVVFPFMFWSLPESPQYLVLKSDLEGARKSMAWYHGNNRVLIDEGMQKLEEFKEWSVAHCTSLFTEKGTRRSIIITLFLAAMAELCGTSVIENYSGVIVKDSFVPPPMASHVSIILAVFRFTAGLTNVYMVEKCGRKFTLLMSIMKMTLTLITLSIVISMNIKNTDVKFYSLMVILILYTLANQLFFGTAEVISTEILSADTKSMTLAFAGSLRVLILILSVQCYTTLQQFSKTANFLLEAIFCVIGVIISMYLIPETQGKSLDEIREVLCRDKHNHVPNVNNPYGPHSGFVFK